MGSRVSPPGFATGSRLGRHLLCDSGSTTVTQSIELLASDAAEAGICVTLRGESVGLLMRLWIHALPQAMPRPPRRRSGRGGSETTLGSATAQIPPEAISCLQAPAVARSCV